MPPYFLIYLLTILSCYCILSHILKILMHIQNILNNEIISHNMISSYDYDHMVYIRLFEGCNLHCEHCFIPSNPKKIELSYYANNQLINDLEKYGGIKKGEKIYLQWHGGEPTLLGYEYLSDAIEQINKNSNYKYMHGIQTNLMNFHKDTEKWVNLYKQYFDSHLGISWDFGIRHIKSQTLSSSETNERFEIQFWENVALANSYNLDLYMVVTATKVFFEHFKNPFAFFEMMVEKGITKLNFERITKTGFARESWNKLGLSNKEYSDYMSKFFKAYLLFKKNNPEINLNISPFDGLLRSVIKLELKENHHLSHKDSANVWDILSYKNQGYGCWSGECDTRFHTIDSNGYKHGCTALTSEQDNKNKSLNINVQKIVWFNKKESQRDTILNERKARQQSCDNCEFISICSSGCLSVEKFDESQECSGAKILFKNIQLNVRKELSFT